MKETVGIYHLDSSELTGVDLYWRQFPLQYMELNRLNQFLFPDKQD